MKTISVFNNKGGVGKTTLLCNLAAYLSIRKNKKVLIIDADPQCNATIYTLDEITVEKIYSKETGTINDIIKQIKKGNYNEISSIPIQKSLNFNVDIIPGDPKLSLAEDFLAKDWFDALNGLERGLRTTLFLRNFTNNLTQYDYVLFDLGPSLGAINRTVLIASDGFILPMSSDIFSLRAIENISLSLTEWKDEIEDGISRFEKKENEQFLLNSNIWKFNIKFLGFVKQQYTAKKIDGKKRPVKAYEKIIKEIPDKILENFVKPLDQDSSIDYLLGEIPYLQSLIPLSQSANTPIFELKAKDGVVGAHFNKVKDFERIITTIGDNTENNCGIIS